MRNKKAKRFVTFLVVLAMLLVDVVQISGINKSLIAKANETDSSKYGEVLVSDVGTNPTLQNGNTSRKLAVASDGTIYAVYRSDQGIRVAKSTDNGASFSPSVSVYNQNYEAEVAVSSSGIVYVTWMENSMIKLSRSTDHAATFSEAVGVGASMGMTVHMTTDGNYLYFIDRSGRDFYKSEDGGSTFSHYDFNENYVFSDVHVDPFTHNVIVQKDNPSITYYISTDHGQTFSEPHMPGNQVYFSVGSIAATADASYLLIAGQNNLGVKVNLATGVSTTPDMGNNMVSQGRSLSDDWYGNVVTGFSDGNYVYFSVSGDLGETFGTPVQVAQTQVANASINSTNGDILFLYERNGQIYLKVFGGHLQGYDLNVSNSSLFFDASSSTAAKKITITNISEDPISIADIKITGDFTLNRTGVGSTLSPGQSGEISVTYNPSQNPTSAGKVSILYGSPTKERIINLNGAVNGGGVVVGPTDPSTPSEPAADLAATASKGTVVGDTKIAATPAGGNHLAVKVSDKTVATPNKGDAAPTGLGVTNPYNAGDELNLGDYNVNRYVAVYELDSSDKVVSFKLLNLQDNQIYGIPSPVEATASKGTNSEETKVNATAGNGNHLAVKVSDTIIETPVEGQAAPIGGGVYNPYVNGTDINLGDYTLNKYLGVYELDSNNKVVGFKLITLSSAEVNITAKVIDASAEKGTLTAETKINVTANNGNHIAVQVASEVLTTPNIGDPAPVGEGVTNPYVPGSDVALGNYTQHKYVGVYELDGDNNIVGFKFIQLTSDEINRTAPEIAVDPEKGSATGESKLIVSPQNGNHIAVKVSDNVVVTPNIGDDAPTGVGVTNPYTSNTDINLGNYTTNKYLAVYELDTNDKVVGFKLVNLSDEDINRQAPVIVATTEKGTDNGNTKVNIVPGIGNHLAVKVSNAPLGTPNIGDSMELGLGITNPYTPGTDINLGDYANNKYLGVYELDSNNKIVGFKLITLTDEDVNRVSPEIIVTPEKGTTLGKTQVSGTPEMGNHLAVMVSGMAVPTPNKGDDMPIGLGITNPYTPGADINLGDYTKNKYLAVYELDFNNKVVGFKLVALTDEDINRTAPEVIVDPQKGTGTGDTKINATVGNGNHLAVKVSDSLPQTSTNVGDVVSTGTGLTNPYVSGTDINLGDYSRNKYLTVYELDGNNKVVGYKVLTLTNEAINTTAPQVTTVSAIGSATGTTKINATVGNGNKLAVKVLDGVIAVPNVGDAAPTGTGVTNPYTSGNDIALGDYTKNKYVAVYELDANNNVLGFKLVTLSDSVINKTVVLTDSQAVTSDKEALQVKYADGDNANSVTKPITLVGTGSNGTAITWSSNPSGLVSKDGTVSRPLFDTDVKLTATISKGNISDTKDFDIKLKGTVPVLYDLNSGSELIDPTDKEKETVTKQDEVNIGGNREYLVDLFIMSIEKKNTNYVGKSVKVEIEEKPVVDTRFFSAIDGKDITLNFTGNKVGWTFNGKDITADKFAGMDKIDLSLKEPSAQLITNIGNKLKTDAGKEVQYATFSYTYDGFLPGKATAKVYIGKQWANKTVDVGRFYSDKNNYDIVAKSVKVDSEGYVAYITDHCSDYFVVETNSLTPTTTTNNLPKTGSPINGGALALAGLMLTALGFVSLRRNRKAN